MTHTAIHTTEVRKLCEARIRWANEAYAKDYGALVEACKLPRWRRWLGLAPLTREQAAQALRRYDESHKFDCPLQNLRLVRHWSTERAIRLLATAQVSSTGMMMVDSDDAEFLNAWAETHDRRAKATHDDNNNG